MTAIDPILLSGGVWLWEKYGKDSFEWLVKRLGKKVEEIKMAGWDKIDWGLASRRYRQELNDLYGSMHIFGMSQPVPLNNIFTDVYLLDKPSAWWRHAIDQLQAQLQTEDSLESEGQRYHGIELIQKHNRLFILGQPGAGKTTFLKHVVSLAVQGKLDAIPIFVSLKRWSDAGVDLFTFLVKQFAICNFPDAKPFIE